MLRPTVPRGKTNACLATKLIVLATVLWLMAWAKGKTCKTSSNTWQWPCINSKWRYHMNDHMNVLWGFDCTCEAVEGVCKNLKAVSKADMNGILNALEQSLLRYVLWPVRFIRVQEPKYGCCFPQMDLCRDYCIPVLCAVYFMDDKYDAISARTRQLEQLALAVILALTPYNFDDELSPDETFQSFCTNYPNHGQLVRKVYKSLDTVLI